MKPLRITKQSTNQVLVERSFDAPVALLWRAYTEPELVKQWMTGPPGHTMPVCEMDVRTGGKFRWVWKMPEGEMAAYGVFREVIERERLVHTETFEEWPDNHALITTTFDKYGGGTLLSVLIEYDSEETRDAVLSTGMADGMEMSYSNLDTLLKKNRS